MIRRLWTWLLGLFNRRPVVVSAPVDDGLSAKNRAIRQAQREADGRRRMGFLAAEADQSKLPERLKGKDVRVLPSGRAYLVVGGTRKALNAPPELTKKERLWLRRRQQAQRRRVAGQMASARPIPIDAEVNAPDGAA